jgi:predicted ATPase
VLLVVTVRPGANPVLEGATIQLAPLAQDESLAMLREMPEAVDLSVADADALAQRAAGNPFFLEELALAVGLDTDIHSNLPETVQAVMEARIADLDIRARTLLYVISVGGPSAAVSLIAHLAGLPVAAVEQDLARLVEQGFLVADSNRFGFRHILLNDTAYAMIAPRDLEDLHARVAQFLEHEAGSDCSVRPETLAWHLQQAGDAEQAIAHWAKASQTAMYRSDRQDAIAFARNGLALLRPDMPGAARQELSLQLSLGTALMAVEGYGSARVGVALERAHALIRTGGSFKSQARIRAGLWVHTWVAGKLPESIAHAEALLDMAREVDDPALLLQAHAGLGAVLVHTGNLSSAIVHLRAGLAHANPDTVNSITIQNSAVTCAAYASWVAGLQGRRTEMQALCDQSFDLGQLIKNPFATAISLALCSESFMFTGDIDGCQRLANAAVDISREHDFPFWLGTGLIMSGWAQGQRGQVDRAFAEIEEGLAVFQETGARAQLANWFGLKADTHLAAQQPEPALAMADLALSHAARTKDTWFTPRIHATAAEACLQLDRPEQALRHQADRDELVRANGLSAAFTKILGSDA